VAGLRAHDCGQFVIACGTEKTLASPWIMERLKPPRTPVLGRPSDVCYVHDHLAISRAGRGDDNGHERHLDWLTEPSVMRLDSRSSQAKHRRYGK
jgi:hypothetical protein